MNNTSTYDFLLSDLSNEDPDELEELKKLLDEHRDQFDEVFDYLNSLERDVRDKVVAKIMKFAMNYHPDKQKEEKTAYK